VPYNERLVLILCSIAFAFHNLLDAQPLLRNPVSTESEIGQQSCRDTIRFFKRKESYDIGLILPSWRPVVSENYVAVLEGKVVYNEQDGSKGPLVSHEDLPFYHYTHDLNFDVIPDATEDNRFTNYSPLMVYESPSGVKDTALRRTIHIEWECGLGAANRINPFRRICNQGKSCGFVTAGHERGDIIWNWPTIGDWVHVEGHLVWDRGHPPSKVEIHPARLVAIRRNLPERLVFPDSTFKYATRVDVFASGDGGALRNNRFGSESFVQKVKMSSKDYEIPVKEFLPKPSSNAVLKYKISTRKGNTFTVGENVAIINDTAFISIPWRANDGNDVDVYAKTFYFYWDELDGVAFDYEIEEYRVVLTNLNIKKKGDVEGVSENRIFSNVGNNWLFLNDFHGKKNKVLTKGLGNTAKKNFELRNEFTVYLPKDKHFRVYMAGWEADGVDYFMGDIFNPYSSCNRKNKAYLKAKLFSINHMLLSGCMDDELGEISSLHDGNSLTNSNYFLNSPKGGFNEDPCPLSKFPLANRYFLNYTIDKIK
jgi:hypothetical protein